MQTAKLFISNSNLKEIEFIPKKEYSLNSNDVIIYTIYLPRFINLKSDLTNFLNSNERNRAERFHKELDKNRFIIYRSVLKLVLAAYTKLEVKNICFDYHSNKKPYLASHPWLHFNISHSEDYAVIAVSRKKVGIDVEYISEDFNFTEILLEVFDREEILSIQNSANKRHAFYNLWTRKEAFVKALGKGIDEDFKYIPCLDGQHTIDSTLLKTTENWKVFSLNVEGQYSAAVALECLPKITPNIVLFSLPNTINTLIGN